MTNKFKAMGEERYIVERLEQYQSWYDKKSVTAKSYFLRMKAASVVGSAIVPVIINLPFPYVNFFATMVSLFVVIVVSLESVFHYGEQWKNYRSTEQFLSREKVVYLAGEGAYKGMNAEDAFILLVERCEAQIAAENSATLNIMAVAVQKSEESTKVKPQALN